MSLLDATHDIFNLKGFDSVFDNTLSNEISDNLVEFFDWGLLQKGNYFNVDLVESGSILSVSTNRGFASGVAWEGDKPNWIWQSGVLHNPAPISVSGIYVDDTFYPSNITGAYAHHIDFYNGRVVFDSSIPVTSKVQVEHSYKWIGIEYANSFDGMRVFADDENTDLPKEMLSSLPMIAIEIVSRPKLTGYQLGGGQYVPTTVLFHCIAKTEMERNLMVDIVSFQNEKSILTFNTMSLAANNELPLDYRGVPISGAMNYPQMVMKYPKYKLIFKRAMSDKMIMKKNPLFGGTVKMDVETIKYDI